MKCKNTSQLLERIALGNIDLDWEEYDFLDSNRLISTISEETYQQRNSRVIRIKELKTEKQDLFDKHSRSLNMIIDLKIAINFSIMGFGKKEKIKEFNKLEYDLDYCKTELELVNGEMTKLLNKNQDIENYFKTPYGYVRLSEEGGNKVELLKEFSCTFRNTSYESFLRQFQK